VCLRGKKNFAKQKAIGKEAKGKEARVLQPSTINHQP